MTRVDWNKLLDLCSSVGFQERNSLVSSVVCQTRYKPWKTTQSDAWSNQQETEQMYINSWQEFLETEYAKTHVLNWIDQLQNVIQSNQEIHNEPLLKEENQLDEWMVLSNLFKPFDNEQTF